MIRKEHVEDLIFVQYKDKKGNIVYVLMNLSNYTFPTALHKMTKEYVSFKELFGQIKGK